MARSVVTEDRAKKEAPYIMLHVGLDLSRKRVDVCLISDQGELLDELAAPLEAYLADHAMTYPSTRVVAGVFSRNASDAFPYSP